MTDYDRELIARMLETPVAFEDASRREQARLLREADNRECQANTVRRGDHYPDAGKMGEDAARWRAWRELDEHAAADIAWCNAGAERDAAIDSAMQQGGGGGDE